MGQAVPSASSSQQSDLPPAFCMTTFILMVPLCLVYWALVAQATRIIAEPRFAELPFDTRELVHLELILAWTVALSGIPSALILFITRRRIGLWLGQIALLALLASVIVAFLDTFAFPQRFPEEHERTVSVTSFAMGLILRVGFGTWFAAAMVRYARWLAQREEKTHLQPEWLRRKRFSDAV